ncbi:uncharacterized protein LOC105695890 [Orussus abietinus]|uniref:uncharacterized protein LOC105695890 n=1 Tax=Orussus abietinus TaxID=222816 RepID=UPI000C7160CD|nr:uncharacterized protein LOC105695890 [Orussus abietinus]
MNTTDRDVQVSIHAEDDMQENLETFRDIDDTNSKTNCYCFNVNKKYLVPSVRSKRIDVYQNSTVNSNKYLEEYKHTDELEIKTIKELRKQNDIFVAENESENDTSNHNKLPDNVGLINEIINSEGEKNEPWIEERESEEQYREDVYCENTDYELREDEFYSEKEILRAEEIKKSPLETRLDIIAEIKELKDEYRKLKIKNDFLHKKCADYFKKHRRFNLLDRIADISLIYKNDRYFREIEFRYRAIMDTFSTTKENIEIMSSHLENNISQMEATYAFKLDEYDETFNQFIVRELEFGKQTISTKNSKSLPLKEIKLFLEKQQSRIDNLTRIRVLYITRLNQLARISSKIYGPQNTKIKETMAYEYLITKKTSLVDKLEERTEEIRKLNEKCVISVSVCSFIEFLLKIIITLRHIQETTYAYEDDVHVSMGILKGLSKDQIEMRQNIMNMELHKDTLRFQYRKLQESTGLLAMPMLLRQIKLDLLDLESLKMRTREVQAVILKNRACIEFMKARLEKKTSRPRL